MLLATGSQTKHKQILDRTEGSEFLTANGGIEAKVKKTKHRCQPFDQNP
jgi:hypothetical protein